MVDVFLNAALLDKYQWSNIVVIINNKTCDPWPCVAHCKNMDAEKYVIIYIIVFIQFNLFRVLRLVLNSGAEQ